MNHVNKNCKSKARCKFYGGDNHFEGMECPQKIPKCLLCKIDGHWSSDNSCPTRTKAKQVLDFSYQYGCSFVEARTQLGFDRKKKPVSNPDTIKGYDFSQRLKPTFAQSSHNLDNFKLQTQSQTFLNYNNFPITLSNKFDFLPEPLTEKTNYSSVVNSFHFNKPKIRDIIKPKNNFIYKKFKNDNINQSK